MRLFIRVQTRARRRPPGAGSMLAGLAVGLLGGTIATYLLDRRRGHARRTLARAKAQGRLRRGRRRLERDLHARVGRTRGRALHALHRLPRRRAEDVDDVTLAHRVETIIFRDPHVPKGRVSINAERGAVFLRGELESRELIDDLVGAVRAVPGVRRVESLLHLPGTPAPSAPAGALLRR